MKSSLSVLVALFGVAEVHAQYGIPFGRVWAFVNHDHLFWNTRMKLFASCALVALFSTSVFADFPFEEETRSFMAEVGIGPGSSTNTVSSFVPPQSIASQQMLFGLEEGGAADNLHYSVPGSSTNAPRASVRAFVYDSEIDARKQTCLLLGGASSNPRIAQHYHPENVGDDIVLIRKYSTPGVSTNCLENWCCAIAFNMAVWVETGNCSAPEFSLSLLNAVDIPVPQTP